MSFLNTLAKGFVRSAVNQVGRDGGKVISNKVYGNQHSIPIRNSDPGEYNIESTIPSASSSNREDLLREGFQPQLIDSNIWVYPFLLLGSILIPVLGPLYWVITAARNLFKDETKYFTFKQEPMYVSDRRFKTGLRQNGFKTIKSYSEISIPPTNSERWIFVFKGIVALLFAASIIFFQYYVYILAIS